MQQAWAGGGQAGVWTGFLLFSKSVSGLQNDGAGEFHLESFWHLGGFPVLTLQLGQDLVSLTGHSTPLPPCERGCQSSGIAGTGRGHLPASAATSESQALDGGQESLDQHRCGRFNRLCLREVGFHPVLLRLPLFNIHLAQPARDPSEGLTLLTESEGKRMVGGCGGLQPVICPLSN